MDSSAQSTTRVALSNELHAATRAEHAALNKAITARLPLGLPPHVLNPYLYAAGMTVYGQIYFALETTWDELLQEHGTQQLSSRDHELLLTLKTTYLGRTQRLKSDLQNLQCSLDPSTRLGLENLQIQSSHVTHDISDSLRAKPHLLLAYTWPMYLALFNGGRWIASQLLAAGPDFWGADINDTARDFLSFWYFDDSVHDEHHGDNVKVDFKQRFSAVSEMLTDAERDEVILEVRRIFGICEDMITLLDRHAEAMQQKHEKVMMTTSDAGGLFAWVVSVVPLRNVWQNLRSVVGFAAVPVRLREDFEQPA